LVLVNGAPTSCQTHANDNGVLRLWSATTSQVSTLATGSASGGLSEIVIGYTPVPWTDSRLGSLCWLGSCSPIGTSVFPVGVRGRNATGIETSSSTSPGSPPAIVSANRVRDVTALCTLTLRIRFAVEPVNRTTRSRLSPGATAAGVRANAILTASVLATVVGVAATAAPLVVTLAMATVSARMPPATRARTRGADAAGVTGAGHDSEVHADATGPTQFADIVTGGRAYRRTPLPSAPWCSSLPIRCSPSTIPDAVTPNGRPDSKR